jgi:hypothetical protein
MSRQFLLSLSDLNLERIQAKDFTSLLRDPDWRVRAKYLDLVKTFLERLPALERDVIELYFGLHPGRQPKKQEVIAGLLGISQQAVSHRMYNAFKRITFMMAQPQIDPERMRQDLASMLTNPFTVDVLCDFANTSSQTATAKTLVVSQQRVCWHLNSAIRLLKLDGTVEALFYVDYFENLMRNRNILREVLAGKRRKEEDTRELGDPNSGDPGGSPEAPKDESQGVTLRPTGPDWGAATGDPEAEDSSFGLQGDREQRFRPESLQGDESSEPDVDREGFGVRGGEEEDFGGD